jgi:hypothetical protein
MADAEEKAKAEKRAAAKKRVRVLSITYSNRPVKLLIQDEDANLLWCIGRADEEAEAKENWCKEGGERSGPRII